MEVEEANGVEEAAETIESDTKELQNIKPKSKKKKKKLNDSSDDIEGKYFEELLAEEDEEKDKDSAGLINDEEDKSPAKQSVLEERTSQEDVKSEREVAEKLANELEKSDKTVFVNNLPARVVTNKGDYKDLTKHFRQFGAVDSIRFRSLAFSEAIPRKVAFFEKKFHSERDTVNAYIVFRDSSSARSALSLNGTMFMDRHLRVDSVSHPMPQDTKRCVFVGNLAFEAEEEPLWRYFGDCGSIDYVRIVRDPKTNLGKGFAYIQFKDTMGVDKALLLNEKKMPEGRTLRIMRAKSTKPKSTTRSKRGDEKTRTLQGRARKLIGKAGNALLQQELALEGHRAKPGENPLAKKKVNKKRKERAAQWRNKKAESVGKKKQKTAAGKKDK